MTEPKTMAREIAETLAAKKAMDVMMIDIGGKSSFADYFVMASAGSERQLEALKDHVEDLLEPRGVFPKNIEGKRESGWILMDYGDIIVHIFDKDNRLFYDLERIWVDGETISAEALNEDE